MPYNVLINDVAFHLILLYISDYPFKIHTEIYSIKIEQHCRVMAAAIHAIYDSGIQSFAKQEHQGIYDRQV